MCETITIDFFFFKFSVLHSEAILQNTTSKKQFKMSSLNQVLTYSTHSSYIFITIARSSIISNRPIPDSLLGLSS